MSALLLRILGTLGITSSFLDGAMQALSDSDRNMAMFCHLSSLSGFIIPFGNLIGPLIIWLIKKDESEFVDIHGKEALNFQITVTLAAVVCGVLVLAIVGLLLLPVLGIAALVLTIMAAVKANEGSRYRYPMTLRLIK